MSQKSPQTSPKQLVSVFCMTYNQEATIAQAIEGVLAQKTDFSVELIVHDDASTDGTAAVVRDYIARFPQRIHGIFQTENQYHKANLWRQFLLPASRGDFIAVCEGDDFWTDPEKLQRQVDYMRAHPECAMCFHAVEQLGVDGETMTYRPLKESGTVAASTLVRRGGMFCPTVSLLFRRDVMASWPEFRVNADVYDYPAQVLAATMGTVHYIDCVMATYRFASAGSWTQQRARVTDVAHVDNETRWLQQFDAYTDGRFRQDVTFHMAHLWLSEYRKTHDKAAKTAAKGYIRQLFGKDKWVMRCLLAVIWVCGRHADRVWQLLKKGMFK